MSAIRHVSVGSTVDKHMIRCRGRLNPGLAQASALVGFAGSIALVLGSPSVGGDIRIAVAAAVCSSAGFVCRSRVLFLIGAATLLLGAAAALRNQYVLGEAGLADHGATNIARVWLGSIVAVALAATAAISAWPATRHTDGVRSGDRPGLDP